MSQWANPADLVNFNRRFAFNWRLHEREGGMVDGYTRVDGQVGKLFPQQKCDFLSTWPKSLLIV